MRARLPVTFPVAADHRPLTGIKFYCLVLGLRAHVNKLTEVVTWSETAGSRTSDIYA